MIQLLADDKIKFFLPASQIEKATDGNGKEVMRFGGIASTADKDADDEYLDPNGFDLSFFKKHGFINWHHIWKDKPKAIIGVPIKAEIKPQGFYIEADLFSNSALAREVYELGETLNGLNDPNRKLGFSIEGKVLERKSNDKKNPLYNHISKARITQVAITPTPKNASTFADIIKGNYVDYVADEYDYIEKADPNGGTILYIVDVTRPTGERVTVDEKFNIKIEKSLTTAQDSGGPLKREDLDSKLKYPSQKVQQKGRMFSKSEVTERIFREFPDLNDNQAKQVFRIIEHYNK